MAISPSRKRRKPEPPVRVVVERVEQPIPEPVRVVVVYRPEPPQKLIKLALRYEPTLRKSAERKARK